MSSLNIVAQGTSPEVAQKEELPADGDGIKIVDQTSETDTSTEEDIPVPEVSDVRLDGDGNKIAPSGLQYEMDSREGIPFVLGQIDKYPDTVSVSRVTTLIFDLSDPEQLKTFNKYQSDLANPDLGYQQVDKRIEFTNGTWKVLLTVLIYRFKNPIKHK
jgi:hypothetical protein